MTTTTRKQTPAQARKSALASDYTPFYAVAGLTQVLANTLQTTTSQATARAGQQLAAWQDRSEQQAKSTAEDLSKLVKTLPEQVKALPETTRAQVAELQKQVNEWQQQAAGLVGAANTAYAELAGRGKIVVDETIGSARRLGGLVERGAADVVADTADAVDPAFETVQESVTRARKNVTGRSATETMTPRSAQRAAATRARNATKSAAAPTKTAAKRAAKTGSRTATKTPAKKVAEPKTA